MRGWLVVATEVAVLDAQEVEYLFLLGAELLELQLGFGNLGRRQFPFARRGVGSFECIGARAWKTKSAGEVSGA